MTAELQGNLFDVATVPHVGSLATTRRTTLSRGAWVDVRPNWLGGADEVFATMVSDVPWRAERREMWDQVVDVPRLLHTYGIGEPLPHPVLDEAREVLSAHYQPELGEPFVTAGCCNYRDGNDSVAWHGDTFGRGRTEDTMVAILSLGNPRKLMLRPRREAAATGAPADHRGSAAELQGRHQHSPRREAAATGAPADHRGSASLSFTMGHGDLLVMGGSCQRTWEHAVPKAAHAGQRISIQFRPRNVF